MCFETLDDELLCGMLNFEHLQFQKLVVHQIGNKSRGEENFVSSSLHPMGDDDLEVVLFNFFLTSFKTEDQYRFFHKADLRMNDMYTYCQNIFNQPDSFMEMSRHILQHLYDRSDHPRIKSGEFYMVYFSDLLLDDELVDAVGIFKSESKGTFLQLDETANTLRIAHYEGISTKKLDKGCLIFNTLEEDGYLVKIVDALNKESDEAQYWKEDFLNIKPVEDSVYTTRAYLNLCKDFVEEVVAPEKELARNEQLDILSKSVQYFEHNDGFNLNNFTETVINEPELEDKFKEYKQAFEKRQSLEIDDSFAISQPTVKREKRKLKHLITLDNSIKITLNPDHQDRNNQVIERGFDDDKGLYFYKVYYELES